MNEPIVRNIARISITASTDTGRVRAHNEDNFIVCSDLGSRSWVMKEGWRDWSNSGCLLVLADGMGGANAGEIASSIAVESIRGYFSSVTPDLLDQESARKQHILASVSVAHEKIVERAKSSDAFQGMGTTIVVAWAVQGKLYVCWCGDSRAYKYDVNGLRQITKDHSLVWELVEAGKLTPEEADVHPDNNIITQSLGDTRTTPRPDMIVENLNAGDKVLLCSDGLNNMVDAKTIAEVLSSNSSLSQISKRLIQLANEHGGKDNVTVIILQTSGSNPSVPRAGKAKNRFALAVPLVLIFVILALIGFKWQRFNNTNELQTSTIPAPVDSIKEVTTNRPSIPEPEPRKDLAKPATNKSPAAVASPTEREKPIDTLRLIVSKVDDLRRLMKYYDSLRVVVDSLQAKSNKLEGEGMILVDQRVKQVEKVLAQEQIQRLMIEWSGFEKDPSKKLSYIFSVATLERKNEEVRSKVLSLDASMKNVKLKSAVQ
ncbi:Stp1/IreP family PP2C-type Ser/Thr phosphatase [Chryseolinea sp. T2]|uniref:Stp1/IreP family PP2C-type Ser/Thr phosphatase n=1 Tax=Chryseolinea sp. T2 TaxID=3129255 RepID=UPI003077BC62